MLISTLNAFTNIPNPLMHFCKQHDLMFYISNTVNTLIIMVKHISDTQVLKNDQSLKYLVEIVMKPR